MRSVLIAFAVLAVLSALASCGRRSAPPPPPPQSAWTAADSEKVAGELAEACLKHPWAGQYRDRLGRAPVLRVGEISDRSGDRVPVAGFAAELTKRLGASDRINMGGEKADVVIAGSIGMKAETEDGKRVNYYQIDLKVLDLASGEAVTPLSLDHPVVVPPPAPPAGP